MLGYIPLDQTPRSRHPLEQTPPGSRHPPDQADTPQTRQTPPQSRPPWTRQTPPGSRPPRLGRHPPTRQTPPRPDRHPHPPTHHPPPGKQTPAYGLRAAGTHPTGMHSWWNYKFPILSIQRMKKIAIVPQVLLVEQWSQLLNPTMLGLPVPWCQQNQTFPILPLWKIRKRNFLNEPPKWNSSLRDISQCLVFLLQYDVEHNVEYPQLENRPDFESFGIEMEEVWFTGRNSSMMFGKVCTWWDIPLINFIQCQE